MAVVEGVDVSSKVMKALKRASDRTGANFDYLLRTAFRESSFDPKAKASTSSASGLFQFIEQTWLQTLKQDGPGLGFGRLANHIIQDGNGRFTVKNPDMREKILNLRFDLTASAVLAGAFTKRNADALQASIGRPATSGELYIAHFLGAEGASNLISLAANKPDMAAKKAFPREANANPSIFYDRKGEPRTVRDVYGVLVAKHEGSAPVPQVAAASSPATALPQSAPAVTGGPVAFFGGSGAGGGFGSFFSTGSQPSPAVSAALWNGFAGEAPSAGFGLFSNRDAAAVSHKALFDWLRQGETGEAGAPLDLTQAAAAYRRHAPDPLKS